VRVSGVDRVYLARHGRTAVNAGGRLRRLSNPPLDSVGEAEAQRLAVVLAAYTPAVVISSPLQRAARAWAAWTELTSEYSRGPLVMVSHDAFNTALLRTLDPELDGISQRTACYDQLSQVNGRWRVDFYDCKPQG
jgi:broad specificity phosphatase PhoE